MLATQFMEGLKFVLAPFGFLSKRKYTPRVIGANYMEESQNDNSKNLKLVYFGGEPLSVPVLEERKEKNL